MAKTPRKDRDGALLMEVAAAIGAGRMELGDATLDGECVYGTTVLRGKDKGKITIDPDIVMGDTVIHECVHRMRPDWTERRVLMTTRRLMRRLSHFELKALVRLAEAAMAGRKR